MVEKQFCYDQFPNRLNLGCGFNLKKGYFNIDINSNVKPDLIADVSCLPMLPSNYYEEIIALDVLEHIARTKTKNTLIEWYRLLIDGGRLSIRVPDLIGLFSLLIRPSFQSITKQEELIQCCFGTQSCEGDYHYCGFTKDLIKYYLESIGFTIISMSWLDEWMIEITAQKLKEESKFRIPILLKRNP